MSTGAAPTATGASAKPPLDEVMLAMDVVDTLRRRQRLLDKELASDNKAKDLKARLRKIYAAQGIEVSDRVLEQGVKALAQDRFVYKPPAPGMATRLARLYVTRGRWGKWLGGGFAALFLAWGVYHYTVTAPAARLPGEIDAMRQAVVATAKSDSAKQRADSLYAKGETALRDGDKDTARSVLTDLTTLRTQLEQEYTLRIVSRPGEKSGLWRIPDANPNARNYYLIVEATDPSGETVKVPIVNEENGKTERVSKWALRVDKAVYDRVVADKRDDGIIQNNRFGVKRRGYLQPDYALPTSGAAITHW